MKRSEMLAATLAVPFAVSVPAIVSAAASTSDDLYAAAKKEGGTISFGGALKEKQTEEMLKDFSTKYPGLTVSYVRKSSEPFVQQVEVERRAGKSTFDVINITEPADIIRWKQQNYLAKVSLPEAAGLDPKMVDKDGQFFIIGTTPMIGAYNTNKIAAGQAPQSLKDLITPKYKGQIATSDPSRGGTTGASLLNVGLAIGPSFIDKVKTLDVLVTRGNENALAAVVSGERTISWGMSGYRVIEAVVQEKSPIAMIWWKEGTALAPFYGVIPADAPHPNGARLLLNWLMSRPAQEAIVKIDDIFSTRKDVTTTPGGLPPLSKLPIRYLTAEQIAVDAVKLSDQFDSAYNLK